MKTAALLLSLVVLSQCHIFSSDSKVTYDFNGNPLIYHLFLSMETGLGADDYLVINMPLRIHDNTTFDKSRIQVKLISFSNNLQIVSKYCENNLGSGHTYYYITFGVALTPNRWYEIQLYPNVVPAVAGVGLPFFGLVQLEAISSLLSNPIVYDSNYAFRYIYIERALITAGTMAMATSTSSLQANRVASIYTIDIDVTPTISLSTGANFTIKIHYDSSNVQHTASGTTLLDFSFMGLCQSVTPATGPAAIFNSCEISDDLSTITFSVNSITASQPIRIRTQISNPLYSSIRGLRAYYFDFFSGVVRENKYLPTALQVNNIPILDLGASRVYLLWGISTENVDAQLTPLNLGLYKATSTNVGPFNSFNAGFAFSQTSPIEGRYRVRMYLGATGWLQGSVAHNLPAYAGLKVYCYYNTVSLYLICENVGAFINLNYRYFISGKVFYNSGTGSTIAGFGDVDIVPTIYDSSGNELPVKLYTPLTSLDSINVIASEQFLDTGATGYHNQASRQIGVARIVSFYDDGNLSSTANAMNSFINGNNSTIGIVPDLGVSQQLLMLMKVNTLSGGSGSGNAYHMRVLYNNQVLGFESGADTRGLDFVGYDASNSVWSIEYAKCHIAGNVVCEKYNADTPTYNIQIRRNATNGYNFFGLYKFACGAGYTATPSCFGGNCNDACNIFTGFGTTNYAAGVMSMRRVTFPSTQYHSSLYADSNLLDFVVVFLQGSGFTSASLINAYTMVGAPMQNIKASYVNYFDASTNSYNKGQRLPTMIRIAGGVLPRQSRNATVVGVFFDDNIEAKTFFTTKNKAYDIGCSTGSCLYYPNTGINIPNNDVWHTMRRVEFYNIPPIQNEFNLLVPVTPSPTRDNSRPMPDTLTLAFFSTDYSVGDATGLLRTLSVYRLFGTAVTKSISGGINPINGLARRGPDYFGTYFTSTAPSSYDGNSFSYALNTTYITQNPPNNTFTFGYSGNLNNFNGQFGCGVTLTSLYYNIFSSSTVAFESPPANTARTCSLFGYVYNEQTVGQNPERDGEWIYVAWCPIDSNMSLSTAAGNIQFYNPQYPNVFTSNFELRSMLTYGISNRIGQLQNYRQETTPISSFIRSCTTAKLQAYNPSSASSNDGKQRATFTVSTPQIRMSPASTNDGYSTFKVIILLPVSVGSVLTMQNLCEISDPLLRCTAIGSSTSITITVNYIGTQTVTISYFEMQLYAKTTVGSLGAGGDYTLTIYLPQRNAASSFVVFGTSFASESTFCQCKSNFKIGNTANDKSMVYTSPVYASLQRSARSYFMFNFGSMGYREAFFATSEYRFGFGFLSAPASTDKTTNGNFRCMIYENNNNSVSLSNKFLAIDFTDFNNVRLTSKYTIDEPRNYLFSMGCFGSGTPSLSNTASMTLAWMDGSDIVQQATAIPAPAAAPGGPLLAASPSSLTASISSKKFNTEGMGAFFTFQLTSTQALTQNTRIYINFHFRLSSRLDNEGYVECYLRNGATIIDTYCTFNQDRQLVIWNNLVIAANTAIFIDVYNIQVPKTSDTMPRIITVSVDNDGDYANGVAETASFNDANYPSAGSLVSTIIITKTTVNTTYIRTPQAISIKFDTVTNVLTNGAALYLVLPGPYGQWISRGQTLSVAAAGSITPCFLSADNSPATNVLSSCTFISKRILKMVLSASTGTNLHTLTIAGLYSPSKVPSGRYNQFRFKLFMPSSPSTEADIIRYSFTDYSNFLSLQPDSTLIDLSWKYYDIDVVDSLVNLVDISSQTFIIYIGYFSNVIELRQSLYPGNFIQEMQLGLISHPVANFIHKDGTTIQLGKQTALFRIAANTNVVAGLYTLQYSKTGDTSNRYTAVPPLTLVVSNKKCSLTASQGSYSMPRGGFSVPIVISGTDCIPLNNITITPTFSSPELVMATDQSSNVLRRDSIDGQLFIVARHNLVSLAVGSIVTVTFMITGPEAAYYAPIPSVAISIIDNALYQSLPTASSLSNPTLSFNTATFTLRCNIASKIYWGLGLYPSILNTQALDFEARIISGGIGLQTNFTQPQDFYMRVYGVNYVTTTSTLPKTVYNLKSNAQYIFKYFCVNQMGLISDGQSITFNSLNYGAYLMKVSIIFQGSLTYAQYRDLACSLAINFQVPYSRVMTEAMSVCGGARTVFYTTDTQTIANEPNSNGEYLYNFYIIPDYTIPVDLTNQNIRSALTLSSTSTNIIATTTNSASLPQFIQMQTEDIQFFATPTVSLTSTVSGLNSIVAKASITNMNGFIIIGCMDGTFDANTMTMPTAASIKKGLLSVNIPLLQVKMIYSIQNYNVTFSFGRLTDNREYTFFYFATTEDPTVSAESTPVRTFNAKTLQALVVDINFGHNLEVLGLVLALIILILA